MEDYRKLGVMAALDAVTAIVPEHEGARRRLLHRRHASFHRRSHHGARRRRSAQVRDVPCDADGLHRGRRTDAVHQRKPTGISRRPDVGAGISRYQANGRRFSDTAFERSRVVPHRSRLSDGRASADDRSDGLERRRDAHALPHAYAISAAVVPRQRPGRGPLSNRWARDRAYRYPASDFRRRDRTGSCGAMAIGVQDPPSHRRRNHLPADQRRAQRRHRLRARRMPVVTTALRPSKPTPCMSTPKSG